MRHFKLLVAVAAGGLVAAVVLRARAQEQEPVIDKSKQVEHVVGPPTQLDPAGNFAYDPRTRAQEEEPVIEKWKQVQHIVGPPTQLDPAGNFAFDTLDGRGARIIYCESGVVVWHPVYGAHEVHGYIYHRWVETGLYGVPGPPLGGPGYPTSDELDVGDGRGRVSYFEYGAIYWTPETGAHAMKGSILAKWQSLSPEERAEKLGYPTTDEINFGPRDEGNHYNIFERGRIYYSLKYFAKGGRMVSGPILEKWASLGYHNNLDFRMVNDNETRHDYPDGSYDIVQSFCCAGHKIYWNPTLGARVDQPAYTPPPPPPPPPPSDPPSGSYPVPTHGFFTRDPNTGVYILPEEGSQPNAPMEDLATPSFPD